MFEKETGGESISNEAMSDFAKGMIDMLNDPAAGIALLKKQEPLMLWTLLRRLLRLLEVHH